MILTTAAAVFVFGLLVLVHEFGHFITAKLTGMRVDEFAIGFGPKLISFRRGETIYSIRAIPLGGFNDIAGMEPEDNPAGERGYCEKPVLSRMIVILAGAFMNFVLPVVLFFGIFAFLGTPKPDSEPVFGAVMEQGAAAHAGLQAGDKILKIDDKPISSWEEFGNYMQNVNPDQQIVMTYERDGKIGSAIITPEYNEKAQRALIGVRSKLAYEPQSVSDSVSLAFERTGEIAKFMIVMIGEIFKDPGEADIAGPLGIAQMAGQVAETGFIPLLNFAALLSLNLGIVNLLPVPALDGGHFVALVIEAVRGKPLGSKATAYTQRFGIALLLLLTIFATKNDIVRLFF